MIDSLIHGLNNMINRSIHKPCSLDYSPNSLACNSNSPINNSDYYFGNLIDTSITLIVSPSMIVIPLIVIVTPHIIMIFHFVVIIIVIFHV